MSVTGAEKLVQGMVPGRVYRTHELRRLSNNLARDLEKLVKRKELICVARALYYRPIVTNGGPLPVASEELVRGFLADEDFLLTSFNDYNSLGLGLSRRYKEIVVYNRKRLGRFILDGRTFSFRRPRNFPRGISKEFLYVDVLNNRKELREDISRLEAAVRERIKELDQTLLLLAVLRYGKVATRKFFEGLDYRNECD